MTSLTSLTPEMRTALVEAHRLPLGTLIEGPPVELLMLGGLFQYSYGNFYWLNHAGHLVAELLEELLASRTYSPPSEDLTDGWYVVIPGDFDDPEAWKWDGKHWSDCGLLLNHWPHRVLGSALPPYSAERESQHTMHAGSNRWDTDSTQGDE